MSETAKATPTVDVRTESKNFPGIAERDVKLVEATVNNLSALLRAIKKGDQAAAGAIYPALMKLPKEAERIKFIARSALRRGA